MPIDTSVQSGLAGFLEFSGLASSEEMLEKVSLEQVKEQNQLTNSGPRAIDIDYFPI